MSKPAPKTGPKNSAPRRATTRVITRTVEQDDGDEELPDGDEGEEFLDPTEEVLESVFAEARGHSGVEIRVYKLDPENRTGARAYAMSVSLEDAEGGRLLDTLQRKWKGGEFELMARADGRIVKRAVIAVLPPPEDDKPSPVQAREEIANIVKASMEPMMQVIAEMRSRPQLNFETLATKGVMLLPLLEKVRGLFAPLNTAPAPASDPITLLTQMKQMKDTMDSLGLGDREPDAMDRMITLFNNFKPMLERMATVRAAPRAAAGARPAPAPVTAGGAPMPLLDAAPTAQVPAIPGELQPFIPMLAAAAKAGETVESVGERILAAIPDELVDTLADALEDGSLVSVLLQRAEFNGTQPWLNALAQYVLNALESGEDSGEEADVSGTGEADAANGADDHQ